jgi:predicted O-methyltransferase YrrM
MNIERALATQGWMTEEELTYLASLAQRYPVIVEIGSWRGRSTIAIGMNTNGPVFAVDVWNGVIPEVCDVGPAIYQEFLQNTRDIPSIIAVRLESLEAAAIFAALHAELDAVFIDGNHAYESVKADILAWRPLLRERGVLAGHDYHNERNPGVVKAVDELVPQFRVADSIWTTEGV